MKGKWMKLDRLALLAAGLLALSACNKDRPGNITAEENDQLNNIAETLDTSPDSLTVEEAPVGNGDAGTEEAPAANDTAPTNSQ
jgi:hypothetical protein